MAVILGDAGHYVTLDLDYVVADYVVPPAKVSATITAQATKLQIGASSITSSFDVQADVGVIRGSVSALATSGTLTAAGILNAVGSADLTSQFTITAPGGVVFVGSSDILSEFDVTANGRLVTFSDRQMWNIEAESRTYVLGADDRGWNIRAETRNLTIEK